MSNFPPPPDFNPFEAPKTRIGVDPSGPGAGGEDEVIRRRYLSHEASVKSIGSLYYLAAIFLGVATGFVVVNIANGGGNGGGGPILAAITFAATALFGAIGFGLSNLKPWARWTAVVISGLGLINNLGTTAYNLATVPELVPPASLGGIGVAVLIGGYILYLLLSPGGAMVFSPAYRGVVSRTPHIRYKTSIIVKIFLGMILFVLVLAVAGAVLRLGR